MQLANFSRAVVSGLSVTFLSGLCATAALAASTGCVVGVSPGKDLNLRAGPGLRFQIVGGIPADTCGVAISTVRATVSKPRNAASTESTPEGFAQPSSVQ